MGLTVLVTGSSGLYGVHLVDQLVNKEEVDKVIGVDNMSRQFLQKDPSIESESSIKKFTFEERDFQDISVEDIDSNKVDVVIHLAASISIPESMESEEKQTQYFMNNEYGTFKLIQTLIKTKQQPLLIYASSPEVYGTAVYTPMDINHPMLPRSTYAVTKLAAEKHCSAMWEWYKYPVVIVRNFNTYGENQNIFGDAAVISNFIRNAILNKPIIIHGEGKQTRDFQYVKDAVNAYTLIALERNALAGSVFNIGTGVQTSIKDLAEMIKRLAGSSSEIVFEENRSADLMSLEADFSLISKKTGWKPEVDIETGLKRTIDWYRANLRDD